MVVQTAFLGDVVLTTPLFKALRRLYPGAAIILMVTPQAKPLVEDDPHLDAILTYDKKGGEGLLSAVAKVRKTAPDILLCPHRSHRTSIISALSGAKLKVGFADAGFSMVYNSVVKRDMELHEVDRNLQLLTGLGAEVLDEDRVLHVGYGDREKGEVEGFLKGLGVDPSSRFVGLCPGSVWPTKRWTAEGFAEVATELIGKNFVPVLLGGPGDREQADEVGALLSGNGGEYVDAVGRTSLKALAAWMDLMEVLITNDSGPMHVAAARGTPVVAIFGPTVTGLGFSPFIEESKVVEQRLECRPCGLHGHKRCPEGHFECMTKVSPETVLDAVMVLLKKGQ